MNEIGWPTAAGEVDVPSSTNSSRHHGSATQLLHWATVLLVGVAYVLSPGGSESRVYATASDGLRDWHESVGLLLFALVLLRLMWRQRESGYAPPAIHDYLPFVVWSSHNRHAAGTVGLLRSLAAELFRACQGH